MCVCVCLFVFVCLFVYACSAYALPTLSSSQPDHQAHEL